jgi:site-specific DNA recombinase
MMRHRIAKKKATLQDLSPVIDTRVALYYRVSSDEQAERGTIEAQRTFLRQYASLYSLPSPMNTPMMGSPADCLWENVLKGNASCRMLKRAGFVVYWCIDSPGSDGV